MKEAVLSPDKTSSNMGYGLLPTITDIAYYETQGRAPSHEGEVGTVLPKCVQIPELQIC